MARFFLLLILMPAWALAQKHDTQDLCAGSAAAGNTLFEIYPSQTITVMDVSTDEVKKCKAVITNETKGAYCTVLTVKYNEYTFASFAYAPGQTNGNFNGLAEFWMYMNENGKVTLVTSLNQELEKTTFDGKPIECLKKGSTQVLVKEKFEVISFVIGSTVYLMPKDYFKYK